MRKSKKPATPLQHWVAWKIASREKELGMLTGRSAWEVLEEYALRDHEPSRNEGSFCIGLHEVKPLEQCLPVNHHGAGLITAGGLTGSGCLAARPVSLVEPARIPCASPWVVLLSYNRQAMHGSCASRW